MESANFRPTDGTSVDKASLPSNTLDVMNQESASPRASDAISEHLVGIVTITQALFGREYENLHEIILNFLFRCDLRTMLALRLVSRGFYEFVSKPSAMPENNEHSPLMHRSASSFGYDQFCDPSEDILPKLDFVLQQNTDIHIAIRINSFIKHSDHLKSIEPNRLKIILQFRNRNEVHQLQTLLSNGNQPKFLDKIKVLDFSQLTIDSDSVTSISNLLNAVANNMVFFSNLTCLQIGEIESNTILNLPNTQVFNNITKLTIGKIDYNAVCDIPKAFFNITSLTIGDIGNNGSILSFDREVLKLPDSFPFLKNLTIGHIRSGVTLNLPTLLDKLENLSIGDVQGTVKMPTLLPNLICLNIDTIGNPFSNATLAKLLNLRSLTINKIPNQFSLIRKPALYERTSTCLTASLPNLTKLIIIEMDHCHFKLSTSFPSLISFSIKKISNSSLLELPQFLPSLTNLSIENIPDYYTTIADPKQKGIFDGTLPELLESQRTISKATIKLPDSLIKLTELSINGHHAILRVPSIPDGFKTFIIESPHDKVTRKLLNAINKRLNVENTAPKNAPRSQTCTCQ